MSSTGNSKFNLRNFSIRWRITVWYTLFLSILLVILSGGMFYFSDSFLVNDAKEQLVAAMEDVSRDYLKKKEFSSFHEGVYFSLYDRQERLIVGRVLFFAEEEGFVDKKMQNAITETGSFLYLDRYIAENDQWIRGALSVDQRELYRKTILEKMAFFLPPIFLFILLGGFWILSHALAPLNKIKKTATEIERSLDLSRRIENPAGRDEINRLAEAFNNMLQRVEDSYRREKQFAADVSHELRTPLSVILAQSEYALFYAGEKEESEEALRVIRRQGKQMKTLVENLLQLSGLEEKKYTEKEEIDGGSFCEEYLSDVEGLFLEKGILLKRELDEDVRLFVQKDLFRTLLSNLVSNALKFAASTVEVRLKKENDKIILSVRDDGKGFSPQVKEKIWDRLYQVEEARNKEAADGAGLGLSFVKQIALLHDASVEAESEEGSYAFFKIIFSSSSLHVDDVESEM